MVTVEPACLAGPPRTQAHRLARLQCVGPPV